MFMIPNSSAMDATAGSGGPSTFLPMIVTGQPEQIATLVTQRMGQAAKFLQIIEQLNSATQQLEQAWSGSASEAAIAKISSTVGTFEKIVGVIQAGAGLLGTSGTLIASAQTAYTSVVSAVNPTVASLMSNPWSYGAAVALSTAASSSLRAFIMGIQAALQALGGGQLMQEVGTLMQLIQEIEQLSQSGGTAAGVLPSLTSIAAPITAPVTPPPVATAAGLQAAAGQNAQVS